MATTTKTQTYPQRAAALKKALRETFPGTTFSLVGSRGTGYGWYHLTWTDGPTTQAVDAIVAEHQDGGKYGFNVNTQRNFSAAFTAWAQAQVADYDDNLHEKYIERYRILAATDAREVTL